METKQTAMQELIHWLKIGWKDEDINTVIKKAEQLLEVEKEQIKLAFDESRKIQDSDEISITYDWNNTEQYYNETYKQKDNDN